MGEHGAKRIVDTVEWRFDNQGVHIAAGQIVPLAIAGARLIDGHADGAVYKTLKPGVIRGVRSEGMVCSEKELGLSDEHEGIMVLDEGAPVGAPLVEHPDGVIDASFFEDEDGSRWLTYKIDGNAHGRAVNFGCGGFLRISLAIAEGEAVVVGARFKTNGCGYMAAAADLVKGKLRGRPVAVVRGHVPA